ncbi:MAG: kinase/pyrophosphorylase [Thermodesulfovibrionales bacterium]|nr:kinase/pyrophosphorylase [Thermodesulfovibrionales bacterium]
MKKIFILSDATGQSAMDILRAALVQFENPQVKFTIYPKIDSKEKLKTILEQAKIEKSLIAYTLVRKEFRDYIRRFCNRHSLAHYDIIGPPLSTLTKFLGQPALENPTLLRKVDEKYFKRIEAIEFTLSHDDGKSIQGIYAADIILIGLSRTSKTPTSFFLAQQGFKVINIPIVPNIDLPKEIYQIDQNKIICLTMNPEVLQKVRMARMRHYHTESSYTDLKKIFEEVEYVYALCAKNRKWKMVDTTNKSVEETSREIISLIYGRDVEF